MSRGPGKIQREILKILREHDQTASPQQAAEGLDAIELAALVHYGRAGWCERLLDPQQDSTVRRALAAEAEGAGVPARHVRPP